MKPSPLIFLAATVLIFVVLLLAPPTRWLVRAEAFPGSLGGGSQSREAFVRSHPNDYLVQIGGQTTTEPPVDYARRLVARFPDNPSLRANILRYATQGEIHLARPEEALLEVHPSAPSQSNHPPTTPEYLAAFEADAAAGERMDPDNAYFPMMQAIGLFAAHRDAEGQAAILRAGRESQWREYSEDEVEGRWRLAEAVSGGREGVSRMALAASLLFPHYQQLRAEARLVTAQAVEAELAGQPQEGLALRRSLAHCGDLMRAKSLTYIGSLVGIAITAVSRSRPGGAPAAEHPPGVSGEQWAQERLAAYCDYVTRIGHPDAAKESRAQSEAADQVRHLHLEDAVFGSRYADLTRLVIALGLGWLLASNTLLLLLLGGLALGLSRLSPLRDGLAPSIGASLGFALALLAFLALMGSWQVHGAMETANNLRGLLPSPSDAGGSDVSAQAPLLLGALFGAGVPLLLLMIFSIRSLVKRLPLSVGLVAGFRNAAPPTACILAVLFCGVTFWTVSQENAVNLGLEKSLHGEGQMLAAQQGKAWPGVVK